MESKPDRYSFSKLHLYHTCLIGFIGAYIYKLNTKNNAFSDYGKFCHMLLQEYALGNLESYELLDEYIDKYDENVIEEFPKMRGKSLGDKYYADGLEYFTKFNGFGEYKILEVEKKFEVTVDNFIFNGVIDLVLEDSNGNIIVEDHKSKNKFESKSEELEYRTQLYLYSIYIYNTYGKYPTKLIFNMFRNGEQIIAEFNKTEYDNAIIWMKDTVNKIRQLYKSYGWFFCNQLCSNRETCGVKKEIESNSYWKEIIKKGEVIPFVNR